MSVITNFVVAAITIFATFAFAADSSISLSKATFKLSYVQDGEKMNRVKLSIGPEEISEASSADGFSVGLKDSITVQASFVDQNSDAVSVHQLFLRFVNKRLRQDNLFLLKRRGREMKADFNFKGEIRSDLDFWTATDSYIVELVMGDLKLAESRTWTITKDMRFDESCAELFKQPERGVFDFDVSVKKQLLPEFHSPNPEPEKRAPMFMILAALVAVMLPLPVLFVGWSRLGVFPLRFPSKTGEKLWVFGFELCLVGHLVALTMFWVRWNIVTTWKVMGLMMVPTIFFGKIVLSSDKERRDE